MNMQYRRPGSGKMRRTLHLRTPESVISSGCDSGPIVAVETRGGWFDPGRPDRDRVRDDGFSYEFDADLTDHLLERERKVIDHAEIARRVIFEGYFQFFEFLHVEVKPADADFHKYPYGGYPPEAFHHGVTQEVLVLRHVRVLAAMVQLGAMALSETDRRKLGGVQEEAGLALAAVIRAWERAFAEQKPLPPDTPNYYRRAQFWLPPHVYAGPVRAIEAQTAPKLLTGPARKSLPADFWT